MTIEAPKPEPERPHQPRSETVRDRKRRNQYEDHFEAALTLLEVSGEILSWETALPEDRSRGIHYLVETSEGIVPFGITSTHRKAQEKRKHLKELKHTTINLIGQHESRLKPTGIISLQIQTSIQAYFASREASQSEGQPNT